MTFDVDELVESCRIAVGESEPRLAVKEVLEQAMARRSDLAEALPPERAGITTLHNAPDLTVLQIVWTPHMHLQPHDHRMWAAIGIYTGGEDNTFYRRAGGTLTGSGGRALRPGDVTLLGDDTIHSVVNPTSQYTGAIHVYGGDFFRTPRSEWDPETLEERPFDPDALLRHFEAQNEAFEGFESSG